MYCHVTVNEQKVATLRLNGAAAQVNIVWSRHAVAGESSRWLWRAARRSFSLFVEAYERVAARRRPTTGRRVSAMSYQDGAARILLVGGVVGGADFAHHLSPGDSVRVRITSEERDAGTT
jgi:hypothetical protein